MEYLHGSDLKAILHSKRANIYYLEHCRVMQKDGRVLYLTEAKNENQYWNIPDRRLRKLASKLVRFEISSPPDRRLRKSPQISTNELKRSPPDRRLRNKVTNLSTVLTCSPPDRRKTYSLKVLVYLYLAIFIFIDTLMSTLIISPFSAFIRLITLKLIPMSRRVFEL